MSAFGDLLELLYNARRSFSTLRGELRERRDLEVSERARERLMEQSHRKGQGSAQLRVYFEQATDEPPAVFESNVRFWFKRPAHFREEWQSPHPYGQDGVIAVRANNRWWRYDPQAGAVSNEDDPAFGSGIGQWLEQLTDPVDLLAGLELQLRGEREHIGRAAVEVEARPRAFAHAIVRHVPYEFDALRVLVDRERGIVLRRAMLFEGQESSVSEFRTLAFDEQFPPNTFTLALPEGETFVRAELHRPDYITVDEAARRASFPVLAIPTLPAGNWRMLVLYIKPCERPPLEEEVFITYIRDDAREHILLHERARGSDASTWTTHTESETLERDGIIYTLVRGNPDRLGQPSLVLFERGGTAIRMSSEDLDLEQLFKLANTLEPA